jgi:eukaryotic-like serine/threonine-protein kinase
MRICCAEWDSDRERVETRNYVSDSAIAVGSHISHYQITGQLGVGGMGEVYRARDPKLNREVAIKVLPQGFAQDAERIARFQREAQVLASLNHPNIAAIYGVEESDGIRALVMELVEGPTLADRITAGPIPLDEALTIARQIAEALEVAHERGVIHRDLKPANVKVTTDDKVKVLDFGLAKALSSDPTSSSAGLSNSPTLNIAATTAGVILGTAGYMSPEQAKGKPVDRRADIWSFGVVLHEMLTGKPLYSGETVTETLAHVITQDPALDNLPAGTPARIRQLLRRCLTKDPKSRLRDIGEARIVLEQVAAGEGPPESAGVSGFSARRGQFWALIGATAVAAAALAAFVTLQLRPARPEPALRQFRLDIHNFQQRLTSRPKLSPDGRNLAYVVAGKLWIQPLDEIKPREVDSDLLESSGTLIWSHDGRSLAYSRTRQLYRVLAAGGTPTQICKLPDAIIDGAWSSDDQIVFSQWRGDIYQVSAKGGEPKALGVLKPESEVDFHSVSFLPGTNVVMFTVHTKTGPYRTELLVEGERRVILDRDSGWTYVETGHLLISRQGETWAVPFSLSELKVTGDVFQVLDARILGIAADWTVLYSRGGGASENQIVIVSRSGEIQQKIGAPLSDIESLALSPDGNRLAVTAKTAESSDIWVDDLVRNVRTLAIGGEKDEASPVWSPDGRQIYYEIRDGMDASLSVKSVDGTGDPRGLGRGGRPSLSKSPEVLAYSVPLQDGRAELWYQQMSPGGTAAAPNRYLSLSEPGARIWLSPNAQFAAYRSVVSGKPEIYLSTFPSGEGRWQVSVDGGTEICWSAKGDESFYSDLDETLFSVSVNTQPTVLLGKPQRLFSLREKRLKRFAVTADGQRFVTAQALDDEAVSPALYVLQGWPALLKQAQQK